MMISIGDRRSQVRHFPWVSAAVAACCVFAFGLSSHALRERERELALAVLQVRTFVSGYPNLQPSATERDLVGACRKRVAELALGTLPAPRPRDRELQAEVDARCADVAEAWAAHPLLHWGLVPARPAPHAWLSYAFVHGSALHLAGNMVLLLLVGSALEALGGRALFVALYVSAIAASAFGFRALHPQLEIPLVGASGAIAALMGALLVRCWDTRLALLHLYWSGEAPRARVHVRAWTLFPVWLGAELWGVLAPGAAVPSPSLVAHGAHAAGFAYGVCAGVAVRAAELLARRARTRGARQSERAQQRQRRARADAVGAERAGDAERAFEALRAAAVAGPAAAGRDALAEWRETVSALWELARRRGRAAEVTDVVATRLSRAVADADWDEALADLIELAAQGRPPQLTAGTWVGLVCGLLYAGQLGGARRAAELALGRPEHAAFPAERGLDLARAAQRQSLPLALCIARLSLAQSAIPPEVRTALEALCRECEAPPTPGQPAEVRARPEPDGVRPPLP